MSAPKSAFEFWLSDYQAFKLPSYHLEPDVPTTDAEAHEHIRGLGYPSDTAKCMIVLYNCRRAQGVDVLEAFKQTLIAALPDETLCKLDIKDAREELARRNTSKETP